MSIISVKFLFFLFVSLFMYYVVPRKIQWKILLIISYLYYLIAGMENIVFLILTSLTTFFTGKKLDSINIEYDAIIEKKVIAGELVSKDERQDLKQNGKKQKRKYLVFALVFNFGILFALKYSNVLNGIFAGINSLFGFSEKPFFFSWTIPIGISYYTFQSMGYLIDLYRKKYSAEKDILKFMLFVSYFPQLIQGPINRYDNLSQKLYDEHSFCVKKIFGGAELITWGLFKKLVISDRLAVITGAIFGNPERYSGCFLIVATVLSMIQLYTDFSGGIDIVRGISEMFGINLPENFLRPFFARNMAEYWRRWHITLNNWWRDYIFYPLSLSKTLNRVGKGTKKIFGNEFGKKFPILISIVIIRIINSIWHGATGSSILGGLYYGIILAASFYLEPSLKKITIRLGINTECFSWKLFQIIRTFCLMSAPRLVSNAKSLSEGANYFRCLFLKYNPWILFDGSLYKLGLSRPQFLLTIIAICLLVFVSYIQEKGKEVRVCISEQNIIFRWFVYTAMIYLIILLGAYGNGYDAKAFIYAQF